MSSDGEGMRLGRYVLYDPLAAGGMATVHLARMGGAAGFSRTVAIKRLHAQYAQDPDFVSMFVDEARIVSRIRHPNVVQTLDIDTDRGELFLVMEYVNGESLARMQRAARKAGRLVPPPVAVSILLDVLNGLHAAHEATDESGQPLHVVHRDVSPQNVLVGADGIARVIDFGVAKAASRSRQTSDGSTRGKLGYMAPEHVRAEALDRRSDVFAAGIILWELLAGTRLFEADNDAALVFKILTDPIPELSPEVPRALAAVAMRALAKDAGARFATAAEMATALERAMPRASAQTVSAWVEEMSGEVLRARAARLREIEVAHARMHGDPSSARHLAVAPSSSARAVAEHPSAASGTFAAMLGTRGARPAPTSTPGWLFGALGVVVLMALVGLVLTIVVLRDRAQAPATASSSAPPPSVALTVITSTTAPVPAPAPSPSEPVTPPPAEVAIPSPSPSPSPSPLPSPAAPTAAAPARSSKPAVVRPSGPCAVPYTVDSHGIHHPKPECL